MWEFAFALPRWPELRGSVFLHCRTKTDVAILVSSVKRDGVRYFTTRKGVAEANMVINAATPWNGL